MAAMAAMVTERSAAPSLRRMKNTLYAVAAASLGMLVTSGFVALAVAAPPEDEAEAYVSEMIDLHYQACLDNGER